MLLLPFGEWLMLFPPKRDVTSVQSIDSVPGDHSFQWLFNNNSTSSL